MSLDQVGDWTITIGIPGNTGGTLDLTDRLGRLGFFHAADSDGVSYLLWTSAFEKTDDPKEMTVKVLLEALNTIQGINSPAMRYIS